MDRPSSPTTARAEITYEAAHDISHRVAAALHRDGYGAGTPIAVLNSNSTVVFPVVLGVVRSGAVWLAVNARSGVEDIGDLLTWFERGC